MFCYLTIIAVRLFYFGNNVFGPVSKHGFLQKYANARTYDTKTGTDMQCEENCESLNGQYWIYVQIKNNLHTEYRYTEQLL